MLILLQYAFARDFRRKGMIPLTTYLREYRYVSAETESSWDLGLTLRSQGR